MTHNELLMRANIYDNSTVSKFNGNFDHYLEEPFIMIARYGTGPRSPILSHFKLLADSSFKQSI
jgi:hypothetical protein